MSNSGKFAKYTRVNFLLAFLANLPNFQIENLLEISGKFARIASLHPPTPKGPKGAFNN